MNNVKNSLNSIFHRSIIPLFQLHSQAELSSGVLAKEKETSLLKSYLSHNVRFGEVIENLIEALSNKAILTGLDKKTMHAIKRVLSILSLLSGSRPEIFKENLKGDLKGQLLRLQNALEGHLTSIKDAKGKARGILTNLLNNIRSSIDNINNIELKLNEFFNYISRDKGLQQFLQIAFSFPEGVKIANLYLLRDYKGEGRRKKRGKEIYSIIFLMDMKKLGSLRIDVSLKRELVTCRISVEEEKVAEFIREVIPEFRSRLEGLGVKVLIDCMVAKSESFEKERLRADFGLSEIQIVNLRV